MLLGFKYKVAASYDGNRFFIRLHLSGEELCRIKKVIKVLVCGCTFDLKVISMLIVEGCLHLTADRASDKNKGSCRNTNKRIPLCVLLFESFDLKILIMLKSIHKLSAGLISVIGVFLSTLKDNGLKAGGKCGVPLSDGIHLIGILARVMTCDQVIKSCAETVDISSCIRLTLTSELLGSRIASCTETLCVRNARFLKLTCCTEVDKHYVTVRLKHYVCRLHVTVDNGAGS